VSCGCYKRPRKKARFDISGERFGSLVAIEKTKTEGKITFWTFLCDCGKTIETKRRNVTEGKRKSCGCKNVQDMTGQRFGKLIVLKQNNKKGGDYYWDCLCDCGNKHNVSGSHLRTRNIKSCGCLLSEIDRTIDLTGHKYSRLTVIKRGETINHITRWVCLCDCGNETTVETGDLRKKSGSTTSCGCYRNELISKMAKENCGEKSPRWNPNLTDEDRGNHRRLRDGLDWSRKVKERDLYTCKVCNQAGGKLNSHHLDGWNWCEDRRFDLDNGVTLCCFCHKDFHHIYGMGDNTAEEFFEYYLIKRAG
jgi:hypothetical protein